MFEFVLKGAAADAQGFGGIFPVAGNMSEGLTNEHSLDFSQRRAWANGKGGGIAIVFAQRIRKVFNIDDRLTTGDDQALDGITELPHVARPRKTLG